MSPGPRRILVTGATGFVGRYLVPLLSERGAAVLAAGGRGGVSPEAADAALVDINDERAVASLVRDFRPDAVVHLAAVSSVAAAWNDPVAAIRVNVMGTLCLLAALRDEAAGALLLSLGSGEEYGGTSPLPRREEDPAIPGNPYGVSKLAQGLLVSQLAGRWGLRASHLRAFNLIGPGQSSAFVVADWASQIAAIELGHFDPVLQVGDIDVQRDFLDVRDACDAICAVLFRTDPAPLYNLCRGSATPLRVVLDALVAKARIPVDVRVDAARLRQSDVPVLVGDPARLMQATGWRPTYALADTLADVLTDCRARLAEGLAT